MPQPSVIEIAGLSKSYLSGFFFRRENKAVRDVSLKIAPGRTLAVVGESGCGKTTLARMAAGLLKPDSGSISFKGRSLARWEKKGLRKNMQVVFQDADGSLNPNFSTRDLLLEPLLLHGLSRSEAEERLPELLSMVGLVPDLLHRHPHEMSGGQRQRIGIARAMCLSPALVIADEPVSALDRSIQAQILSLLQSFQSDSGVSYLYISHDLGSVRAVAHDVAVMLGGLFVETGPAEDVFANPLHPYTKLLLADDNCAELPFKNYSVDLENRQGAEEGCPFAGCCNYCEPQCTKGVSGLIEVEPERSVRCRMVHRIA